MKYTDYEAEIICKGSLFTGLSKKEILKIVASVQALEFKTGEIIFREDSIDNCLFIVIRGQTEIVRINEMKEEILITIMSINDFFGEMAFLTGEPRTASVRSKGSSKLVKINYDEFMMSSIFSDYSKNTIILNVVKKLGLRLTKLNHDYVKLLNVRKEYFDDMDSKSIFELTNNIAKIRNKYLG